MQSQKGKQTKEILAEMVQKEKENLFKGAQHIVGYCFFPGVYLLFKDLDLVYIGESNCIMTRICQHWVDKKDFNHFKVYEVIMDTNKRKALEKRLIKKHRPILNMVHNDNMKFKNNRRQVNRRKTL